MKQKKLITFFLAFAMSLSMFAGCGNATATDSGNAQAAYEKLASMVSGTIYGEEAVAAYTDGNGVYDCSFTEGVILMH